jgi:transposase-like protein
VGNPCSVCRAPAEDRERIDFALRTGESGVSVAKRFGLARSTLYRHRETCLKVSRRHQKARAERLRKQTFALVEPVARLLVRGTSEVIDNDSYVVHPFERHASNLQDVI